MSTIMTFTVLNHQKHIKPQVQVDDSVNDDILENEEDLVETPAISEDEDLVDQADKDEQEAEEEIEMVTPEFEPVFTHEPLTESVRTLMTGISWTEAAPVTLDELSLLTLSYVNFEGEDCYGQLVVRADLAEEVVEIFREIYEAKFPIGNMELIDAYGGDDNLSMAANNCSAFNYRVVPNSTSISKHSYGIAIDVNPVQNPYLPDGEIMPEAGAEYLDRENIRPGMIVEGGVVYEAFISRGWTWGGHWTSVKDYHHFVKDE